MAFGIKRGIRMAKEIREEGREGIMGVKIRLGGWWRVDRGIHK